MFYTISINCYQLLICWLVLLTLFPNGISDCRIGSWQIDIKRFLQHEFENVWFRFVRLLQFHFHIIMWCQKSWTDTGFGPCFCCPLKRRPDITMEVGVKEECLSRGENPFKSSRELGSVIFTFNWGPSTPSGCVGEEHAVQAITTGKGSHRLEKVETECWITSPCSGYKPKIWIYTPK